MSSIESWHLTLARQKVNLKWMASNSEKSSGTNGEFCHLWLTDFKIVGFRSLSKPLGEATHPPLFLSRTCNDVLDGGVPFHAAACIAQAKKRHWHYSVSCGSFAAVGGSLP